MASNWHAKVMSNQRLTANMRRIVLADETLRSFPTDSLGGYVKVAFEGDDTAPDCVRSYTVRALDADAGTLTLDFVDHGDHGPASRWARRSTPGDDVSFRGPGAVKLADPGADWFLLASDMAGLPALSVALEHLPADARGHAFIEVLDDADRQALDHPPGVAVHWLVNPKSATLASGLPAAVRGAPWLDGTPWPWVAAEFDAMRDIRRYLRDERQVPRKDMYVSCYWKIGTTDEGMKAAKRADPEA